MGMPKNPRYPKNYHRPNDREQEAAGTDMASALYWPDELPYGPSKERPRNAKDRRHHQPHRIFSGKNQAGQTAGNQPDDYHFNNVPH